MVSTASTMYCLGGQGEDIGAILKKYNNNNDKIREYSQLMAELSEKLAKMAVENQRSHQNLSNNNLCLLVKQEETKCPIAPFQVYYNRKTGRPTSVIWLTYKKCILFKVPGEREKTLDNLLSKR